VSRLSLLVLVVLAVVCGLAVDLHRALPPNPVVIQAGPHGGSFEQHARRYASELTARGLRVEVRNQDDSLHIIDKVANSDAGVQIGFIAQRVDASRFPGVASAGVVELQPLFMFFRRDIAEPATPAALVGKHVVMPAEGSATAHAATELLALYGVTPRNTTFTFLPMNAEATALLHGDHDAGFFMLASDNVLIRRLATAPQLLTYSFTDSIAIVRHMDYLRPATLVRGAFDLQAPLPTHEIALVGANVEVVVRRDIHPAVLYALLQALNEEHKGQSLVTDAGDYPRQAGVALPMHPLAEVWSKRGTPWLFSHFPPSLAGVIDAYWGPVVALITLVSIARTIQSVNAFVDGAALTLALQLLSRVEQRMQGNVQPSAASRSLYWVAKMMLVHGEASANLTEQLERLRPYAGRR